MQVDITGGLRDLAKAADRIAALFEWEKLAEQERGSRALPGFRIRNHNREDIIDLYGAFLSLSRSLHAVLNGTDIGFTTEQWKDWQEELREVEERVQSFNIMDKYIKP